MAPAVRRVGIMFNPQPDAGGGLYFVGPAEAAALSLAMKPIRLTVQSPAEIERSAGGVCARARWRTDHAAG